MPAVPQPGTAHQQALILGLCLPPLGLLHPGPGGPEDLRVEGEEGQCPGEEGSHKPGPGGHGVGKRMAGRGQKVRLGRRGQA